MSDGPLSIVQILEKTALTTGSVVQMMQLAEGLSARGHRVTIVSRAEASLEARARAAGAAFEALPLVNGFDLGSARRLAALLDARQVEIVHAHKGIAHAVALYALYLSRARPGLVVNRGVSFPLDVFNRIKFHLRLDAVVAVSEAVKRVVVTSGRIPSSKVHVIYAGVDLARFDPLRADRGRIRREWGIADAEPLIVQVGAREWNGWRDYLASAALAGQGRRLKVALVACVDAAHQSVVMTEARRLGIADRVLAVGFRDDIPEVLAAADIIADLSYEGLGITGTIREAMALERPVVASSAGGNPELVVDGESGLLVPPRQPATAAAALCDLLDNPDRARQLGRAGRARVSERFSSVRRIDEIESLYRQIVANRVTDVTVK